MANRSRFQMTPEILRRIQSGLTLALIGMSVPWTLLLFMTMGTSSAYGLASIIGIIFPILGIFRIRGAFLEYGGMDQATEEEKEERQTLQVKPREDVVQPALRTPVVVSKPQTSRREAIDWEEWVGQKLLQKLGIVIVLIGMLVLLKYSWDNIFVGPMGRIAISTLGGVILLVLGEVFHKRFGPWAHSFTGGGLALLYFTVWAANAWHHLALPPLLSLSLYSAITFLGAVTAVRYKAQEVAWFTVLGGYATPLLLGIGGSVPMLITFLAILSAGVIALAWFEKWKYLNSAAFAFTNAYLWSFYMAGGVEISNMQQLTYSIGFFLLFSTLPFLYQFRLGASAEVDDVGLIIANTLSVYLAVTDALGGFSSEYTTLVCLALALVCVGFGALALLKRPKDDNLINTYLVSGVIFIALALYKQLGMEWVAAGWAPFSLLLVFVSVRLQRKGPWACAMAHLFGALAFLAYNLPLQNQPEANYMPFISDWSLQSYIVFASLLGWVMLSKQLPKNLLSADRERMILGNMLQSVLAFLLFTFITIEVMIMNGYDPALHHASLLVWHPNLFMTYGYLLFTVIALGIFAFAGSIIWLGAAFFVQMILFLLTFFAGEGSGMVWGTANVTPFFHPWALPSVLLLGTMALMVTLVSRRSEPAINNIQNRTAMIGIALAQVWLHVTVELQHLGQKLVWHPEVSARVLSMWWIFFAVAVLAAGFYFQKSRLRLGGMVLLIIPFVFNVSAILEGSDLFLTAVWTILPLALAAFGGRYNYPEVVKGGLCFLGITCLCDLLSSVERRSGVISLVWWAAAASVAMGIGFKEHQKFIRQCAIGIFAIITFKLFTVDLLSISNVGIRICAYVGTGLLMVGASYLYQRFDTSKPKK